MALLPPANELCIGYVFTGVCLSTAGGHAWLLAGGMHGCWGACMVAGRRGHLWLLVGGWGHVWLLVGGMRGCRWGACSTVTEGGPFSINLPPELVIPRNTVGI